MVVSGNQIGQFLDHVVQAGIPLEDLVWKEEEKLSLVVHLRHFFSIYRSAKMYKLKLRIEKKIGMPFFLKRVKKRKFFAFGAFLFFLLLTILSSFVWKVDIVGNEQIPTPQVLSLLKSYGVYPGQLKVRLPDPDKVQFEMKQQLPQATWIGLQLEGTRVVVTIVEKRQIEENLDQDSIEAGEKVHLIAKKNAMIYDLKVIQGNPLVTVHDVVKKGQILVSGYYGNPDLPETQQKVGASGVVLGQVWYQSEVQAPMKLERKEYTGEKISKTFPFVGSYILRNPFAKKAPFSKWETDRYVRPLKIGSWEIPLGLVKEEYREMKFTQEILTMEQATLLGIEQARRDLLQKLGKYGKILEEKVLHRRVENGKVYLKIHFDAVENIAVPEPLVQGDERLDPTKKSSDSSQPSE